jgi:hypothetical protein
MTFLYNASNIYVTNVEICNNCSLFLSLNVNLLIINKYILLKEFSFSQFIEFDTYL